METAGEISLASDPLTGGSADAASLPWWRRADWLPRDVALSMAALTLALWVAVGLISLSAMLPTKHPLASMIGWTVVSVMGAALCAPLYVATVVSAQLRPVARVASVAAATVALAATQSAMDYLLFDAVFTVMAPERPMAPFFQNWKVNMMIYVWTYAFYATAATMILILTKAQAGERQLLQARAMADQAQLHALRLQINPHFLFNALNAATSLVSLGRTQEAECVLLRLSEFFRSSLTTTGDGMVPLETEFDDLSAYLEIESVRFGERLDVQLDLPDELRPVPVPHFIVQPLVENAVKHGVVRSNAQTTITVLARAVGPRLQIRIENEEPPPNPAAPRGAGVGLTNVRSRLAAIYGNRGELTTGRTDGRFWSQIELPADQAVTQTS